MYKTIINFILKNEKLCGIIKSYDIIIPVPISKKRKKQRGYNQSYLIAKELSKSLEVRLIDYCLYKFKDVIEQSKLNKEERKQNLKNVYLLKNEEIIKDKRVLLIDDIFTTGATANECCKTLHQAKIKEVSILTIAKD